MRPYGRKMIARVLIALLLLLSLSSSALAAGITVTQAPGGTGRQYTVKEMLTALGYPSPYSGNLVSARTVRQFQADNGLPATGRIDSATYTLIKVKFTALPGGTSPRPVPTPEPKPEPAPTTGKVCSIKEMLEYLGYQSNYPGSLVSASTVRQFQLDNGLPGTGRIDIATYNLIQKYYNAKASGTNQPTPTPTPTPEPTPEPEPKPSLGLTADEQIMVDLVNAERVKVGLPALKIDMRLVQQARLKSRDMIDKNYFDHISPTYGSPFEMMRNAGISYRAAGENIAGANTVERAHVLLMNSSGHRANILGRSYTHFGIGIIDGGPYGKMFTQMFIGI